MKKIFILLLFIKSFLFCDFLMILSIDNNTDYLCVKSYSFNDNSINFNLSKNDITYVIKNNKLSKPIQFLSGYIYSDGECKINDLDTSKYQTKSSKKLNNTSLSVLGLSNKDLNFMFALSGTLCAFMFIFGLFRWI